MVDRFESADELHEFVQDNTVFFANSPVLKGEMNVKSVEEGRSAIEQIESQRQEFIDETGNPLTNQVSDALFTMKVKEKYPTDTAGDTGKWIFAVYSDNTVQQYPCDENWNPTGAHHVLRVRAFSRD